MSPNFVDIPTGGLHTAHVTNRQKVRRRDRTPRPCDLCGKPTKAAAGRCSACSAEHGHLCSVCGAPSSGARCLLHTVPHFCPVCGHRTKGECDACDACAVGLGWMTYNYRGVAHRVPAGAPCAVCGRKATDSHHVRYKPVLLIYLCRSCHRALHKGRRGGSHSSRVRTSAAGDMRISARQRPVPTEEAPHNGST